MKIYRDRLENVNHLLVEDDVIVLTGVAKSSFVEKIMSLGPMPDKAFEDVIKMVLARHVYAVKCEMVVAYPSLLRDGVRVGEAIGRRWYAVA